MGSTAQAMKPMFLPGIEQNPQRSYEATKDKPSWKSFRWVPGPPGVGRICSSCWSG